MGRDCSCTAEPILESSHCQELPDLSPQGQHRSKPLSDLCLSHQALLSGTMDRSHGNSWSCVRVKLDIRERFFP